MLEHASIYVDPSTLVSFTACQLIASDNHPGVRPVLGMLRDKSSAKLFYQSLKGILKQEQETSSSVLDRHRDVKLEFMP